MGADELVSELEMVDLKFSAAKDIVVEVCFEPIGTTFSLTDGDYIFLRLPTSVVPSIEIVAWPNGVGVWLPYPGNYAILDRNRIEIDKL